MECRGVVIACSWVHACMYTCGDLISASGVFCHVFPTSCFETESLTVPGPHEFGWTCRPAVLEADCLRTLLNTGVAIKPSITWMIKI